MSDPKAILTPRGVSAEQQLQRPMWRLGSPGEGGAGMKPGASQPSPTRTLLLLLSHSVPLGPMVTRTRPHGVHRQFHFQMNTTLNRNWCVHSSWLLCKGMIVLNVTMWKSNPLKMVPRDEAGASSVMTHLQKASHHPERMISINLSSRHVLIITFIS